MPESGNSKERFRLLRNKRNHLILHVHDIQHDFHYVHRFKSPEALHAYISDLRRGISERVPDALLCKQPD